MSILVSSATILTQMVVSHIVRGRLSEIVRSQLAKSCLLELVAAAEMCATSTELSRVARNCGMPAYSVYLFLIILCRDRTWGSSVTACPYSLLEEYVEVGANPLHVALKVVAQLAGGLASIKWAKHLWMTEVAEAQGSLRVDDCLAALQVPVAVGFLLESLLTCSCRLFSRALGEVKPKFASAIDSFFATCMVLVAFNYSGGYFNPVLATSMKWSCRGHTNTEHIIVYWAGSTMGAMLSVRLWSLVTVKRALVGPFTSKDKRVTFQKLSTAIYPNGRILAKNY
ncbi:aquaporin-11 [Procambarus clarkii]|uniref:aquaporin-11 n=1 Tax=Procambarus clarkii TaxID=6728 RepID=UPI0037446E0F